MLTRESLQHRGELFLNERRSVRLPPHVQRIRALQESIKKEQSVRKLEQWALEIRPYLTARRGNIDRSPRVSVMVPAHNEQWGILATLDSLAHQTGRLPHGIEVIVIDNNSSPNDHTAELAHIAGARVVKYNWPDNPYAYIAYARQEGLLAASRQKHTSALSASDTEAATYGFTTDADVILPPNWISTLAQKLDDPDVAVVYTPVRYYDPNVKGLVTEAIQHGQRLVTQHGVLSDLFPEIALEGLTTQSMAFRIDDALNAGGFDLRRKIREDITLARALTQFGRPELTSPAVWASARRFNKISVRGILKHGVAEAGYGHTSQGNIVNIRE